ICSRIERGADVGYQVAKRWPQEIADRLSIFERAYSAHQLASPISCDAGWRHEPCLTIQIQLGGAGQTEAAIRNVDGLVQIRASVRKKTFIESQRVVRLTAFSGYGFCH